LAIKLGSQQES